MSLDKVFLGDNAFIGVSHLSQERARQRETPHDLDGVARIIDTALSAGAQGLVCSAHPRIKAALYHMKQQHYSREFEVHLIVPDVQTYIRLASESGMIGLVRAALKDLSFHERGRAFFGGGLSAFSSNPIGAMKAYLSVEASHFSRSIPKRAKLRSIYLHELLSELIVSFRLADLAEEFVTFTTDRLRMGPGFVTRNFARFMDFGEAMGFATSSVNVMAPFNKVGFQMNPNQKACEEALGKHPGVNLTAMNILASGYLSLDEAEGYLESLPGRVSCAIGASTQEQAQETFSRFGRLVG